MATIGSTIKRQMKIIRRDRKRPRVVVINWMKRNRLWCREIIAKEWERQTGEAWLPLLERTVR